MDIRVLPPPLILPEIPEAEPPPRRNRSTPELNGATAVIENGCWSIERWSRCCCCAAFALILRAAGLKTISVAVWIEMPSVRRCHIRIDTAAARKATSRDSSVRTHSDRPRGTYCPLTLELLQFRLAPPKLKTMLPAFVRRLTLPLPNLMRFDAPSGPER